ncbi:MAG: HEPN domain-containing protein [bacterium]|nr:HEPN domain-containing protein [bacterium]
MVDKQIIEKWVDKATEDLAFAKASLGEGLEFYPQICFYLHQSVEKYLKAYILSKELNIHRIHDLTQLLKICTEHDLEFNKFSEAVKLLNPFYIGTRYPDSIISINKSDAEKALYAAEEIADLVKAKLSV